MKGTPPNLDVIAEGAAVLAVESKLLEHLTAGTIASFAPVYEKAVAELADESWAAAYRRLKERPDEFQCFSAAQIVKHYLGLKSRYLGTRVILLYLYWQPVDDEQHGLFRAHRAEIARFAESLSDPVVEFRSCSFADLWNQWEARSEPAWLGKHVGHLRDRYLVSVSENAP